MRIGVAFVACALPSAAWACPFTASEVDSRVHEVYARYAAADLDGLERAFTAADEAIACPDTPWPADLAARVHGATAIEQFVRRDLDGMTQSFIAARRTDPAYDFFAFVPDTGNSLDDAWRASAAGGTLEPLPMDLPPDLPEEPPEEEPGATPIRPGTAPSTSEEVPRTRNGPRPGLLVASGATGVVAIASLVTAYSIHHGVEAGTIDPARRGTLQPLNTVTGIAGPVLGVGAVGLGIGAFVVGKF